MSLRILWAALKYDYNRPDRGFSFEHYNFFHCLRHMGCEILYFDYGTLLGKYGRRRMNRRLREVVRAEKPDLLFVFLTADELEPRVLRGIADDDDAVTLNWFADDHYRFDIYSRHWAPCFNWVVTTAHSTLARYRAAGIDNVIASQWACNPFLYRKLDLPLCHDVSFVGAPHGNRRHYVQLLEDAGLTVRWWGSGTAGGRLSQQGVIELFNQSRINLNFSGASVPMDHRPTGRSRALNLVRRFVLALPWVGAAAQRLRRRQRERQTSPAVRRQALATRYVPQIKGRNFEIPGCGGFMLTGAAENLADYFVDGREAAFFSSPEELIEKARHYLAHEDERAEIAAAGYRRCRREHTYVHRFEEIFRQLALPAPPSAAGEEPRPGVVEEVS